jgi:hypothetical protein
MTEETLEEAAKRHADSYYNKNSEFCSVIYESVEWINRNHNFIVGANWQAENMYSEEEVKQIIDATLIEYSDFVLADIPEWFEQFKKK